MASRRIAKHTEVRHITKWVLTHADEVRNSSPEEAAKAATNDLGFRVAAQKIRETAADFDIEVRSRPPRLTRRRYYDALASALVSLYERLGEPVPESLRAIRDHAALPCDPESNGSSTDG